MPPPLPWRSKVHQDQGDCLYVFVHRGEVCIEGLRDCRYAFYYSFLLLPPHRGKLIKLKW